ncbi:hypothetical protein SAMN05421796_11247 [Chryseobacterium piscicola]|uniref:Uncharacterized protein n=1 Tax=Chryseobacterium piscicola TaxID=551459 RepID=A0A1N7PAA2_9FLAO|nr:hypothetical protein [Chryseobacterium piscicola]PQA95386.1 hypothetical protein B0A70_06145 [Chryseobacterium piscicola]SIT07553.1 hypothetical protein SAMN05421796_11247 [Chryseobacterium piscicola]
MKENKGWIICFIILFVVFIIANKIDHEGNADRLAEEECILVVEIPSAKFTSDGFKTQGYQPKNKKSCKYIHHNRWWSSYKNEIEIGDTIVKKKGQLVFRIHKKDSIIIHKYKL